MTVTHIVSFRYKPTTSSLDRESVKKRFLSLEQECLDPQTSKKYILDINGGANSSIEGFGKGFDHTFVLLFSTQAGLYYYIFKDPAHEAFKTFVKDHVEDAFVFDFDSQ